MIESDADRLASIKALGGLLVRHPGGSFWGLFDREFSLSVDGAIESRQPAINARTCDVKDMAKDTVFTVDGEDFRLKRSEPDGTGMTLLILKR